MESKKISIIIPAKDEEKTIKKTLESYSVFFKKIASMDFEIIVVLNACEDNTLEIVKKSEGKHNQIKHLNFERGGKGFAITQGFIEALKGDSDLMGFVDADMSTPPFAFHDLILSIKNYDGVIASRYLPNSIVKPKQRVMRIIASRVFNFLVRSLFLIPYRDTQCGAKIFKRKALEKILPEIGMTQWAYDIDLLYNAHKLGFRIKEKATFWEDKESRNLNLKKASIQMFLAVSQLRIMKSKFKRIWWVFKPVAGLFYKLVK